METFEKYGRLLILGKIKGRRTRCLVECDCGVVKTLDYWRVKSGWTASCGCIRREKSSQRVKERLAKGINGIGNPIHGKSPQKGKPSKIYSTWINMKRRCLDPKSDSYWCYGGKGITLCQDWLSFENFYRDMGDAPIGKTVDRIDNNKGYSKENCRWATIDQQQDNRQTTRRFFYNGEFLVVREIAKMEGVTRKRLGAWIERHKSFEIALTKLREYLTKNNGANLQSDKR